MGNVGRFFAIIKLTPIRLFTLLTLLVFVLSVFNFYSCSDKNPGDREKSKETSENALNNDEFRNLFTVIENLKTQITALPQIPYIAENINYQSLASREDLASNTIKELDDISGNSKDPKADKIKSELKDLLKQWSDAVAELKSNLKDYESIRDESKRLKNNSNAQKGFSNKIFNDLEMEKRFNEQTGTISASFSKLERLESDIRYFNNNN